VVELYGAAKVPHATRDGLARVLRRDPNSVHLHERHVGGGFGIRGELYPEDVLVCAAALRFGRPVKWIEDRREHLMAANHSRQQRHHIRAAVDRDGRILAIDDTFFHDQGAYLRTHGTRVADMTAGLLPGPYRVPAYRVTGLVDKALATVGWDGLQAGLRRRRTAGEAVGAGLAIFVEKSGLGPTDRVTISVDNQGTVEVVTGGASVGQGFETVMAQITADALGVDYRRVRIVHGHTDRIEHGVGAHASRATVLTGSATHVAANALKEKALGAAAGLMQLPVAALDLVHGRVVGRDLPGGPSMDLGEIARNTPGGLDAEGRHTTATCTP